MRGEPYRQERTSALIWLISALIAGFVLQLLMSSAWIRGGSLFDDVLGLTPVSLRNGWWWTLLTHAFLHSTTFIVHVVFDALALYFLGRELLPMLGAKRFFGLFAASTLISGLVWSAVHWQTPAEMHLGCTAAIEAMFIVFACFFPNQQTTFLLLFFPVTLKPKQVAYALVATAFIGLFAYELPRNTLPFELPLASSAHLAGILTGYLYYRFVHDGRWFNPQDRAEIELPRWLNRVKKAPPTAAEFELDVAPSLSREDLRIEVDRILDKINSQGLGALTAAEKKLLDEAKHLLSRR